MTFPWAALPLHVPTPRPASDPNKGGNAPSPAPAPGARRAGRAYATPPPAIASGGPAPARSGSLGSTPDALGAPGLSARSPVVAGRRTTVGEHASSSEATY